MSHQESVETEHSAGRVSKEMLERMPVDESATARASLDEVRSYSEEVDSQRENVWNILVGIDERGPLLIKFQALIILLQGTTLAVVIAGLLLGGNEAPQSQPTEPVPVVDPTPRSDMTLASTYIPRTPAPVVALERQLAWCRTEAEAMKSQLDVPAKPVVVTAPPSECPSPTLDLEGLLEPLEQEMRSLKQALGSVYNPPVKAGRRSKCQAALSGPLDELDTKVGLVEEEIEKLKKALASPSASGSDDG